MKIIVLASGEGKRMWPIKKEKYLIPFLGKPLIYYTLEKLSKLNSSEFIIITKDSVKDEVAKVAQSLNLNHKIVVQEQFTGMDNAILCAKEEIDGEVLIVSGTDQLELNAYEGVLELAKSGAEVVLSAIMMDKYFPGGYLRVEGESVKGIVEKPGEGNEPSDLVKLVVDYFKEGKKLVEYLENANSEKDDVYEIALDKMISDGIDIKFVEYKGLWIPLKYPWQILDILEHLLGDIEQQISPDAKVSEKAIITGSVVIEKGARVFEGAVIKGPCYIGKNVIIGNNSMIRESNLEEGCVTGFNSDITRSYIGANSWFHTNYIGDSVIEGDFGMGSGAVLANLRLDDHTIRVGHEDQIDSGRHKLGLIAGKGSRVGVNASTMPGARVGSSSLVGPGVVLYGDVKDNKKVIVKQELEESDHSPALTSYDQFREKI